MADGDGARKKLTLEIIVRGMERKSGVSRAGRISTHHYAMIESWKSSVRAAIIQTKPLTRFPPISCRNDPRPSKKRSFPSWCSPSKRSAGNKGRGKGSFAVFSFLRQENQLFFNVSTVMFFIFPRGENLW